MVNILVFKIGVNCFGIETAQVKSVTKDAERVKNKLFPGFADGLVDYVLPDKRIDKCRETEFIVASFEGDEFVIPIDEIVDIFQVLEKDIMPIPAFAVRYMAKNFFKGVFCIDNKLILLLDISKLFC